MSNEQLVSWLAKPADSPQRLGALQALARRDLQPTSPTIENAAKGERKNQRAYAYCTYCFKSCHLRNRWPKHIGVQQPSKSFIRSGMP
jgi:hypothetical protein